MLQHMYSADLALDVLDLSVSAVSIQLILRHGAETRLNTLTTVLLKTV